MSSSMGGLAQQHSTAASAVASHKKYDINIMQQGAKCWGGDWKCFFFVTVLVNIVRNFTGLGVSFAQLRTAEFLGPCSLQGLFDSLELKV